MTTGDRALAVDACTVAAVSVLLCIASDRLALMTACVPIVLGVRFVALTRCPASERAPLRAEAALFCVCTALGAFNDWSSVVRHRIYDYTVPHYWGWTTIPVWMLLFWGMILRFLASLAWWRRLEPAVALRNDVRLGRRTVESARLRVGIELAIVLATRQIIYRAYADPIWSWAPFAVGIGIYVLLLRPRRADLTLAALLLALGPLVEALYIHVGGLHRYHLGWLLGVPVWIALWWTLGVLIWKDLSGRLLLALTTPGRPR